MYLKMDFNNGNDGYKSLGSAGGFMGAIASVSDGYTAPGMEMGNENTFDHG